jgi:nitric oxide reductase large subunit
MRLTGNVLSILGCICVIIATYYIYRTARSNNLNAVRWAFVNIMVGFVFQFALPLLIALVVAFSLVISKGAIRDIDRIYIRYGLITNITILTLNFVRIWLIIRQVSRIPKDEIFAKPPLPPNFDEKT